VKEKLKKHQCINDVTDLRRYIKTQAVSLQITLKFPRIQMQYNKAKRNLESHHTV
jgi:hypothetical protein